MTTNVIQSNFAAGELSPKVWGRYDLKIYKNGLEIMENFIAEIQGAARFRTGTKYIHHTRLNQEAVLVPFQFNDEQAYLLEFTDQMIRFYRNASIILEDATTITGASKADPCVITDVAHGYVAGDEVFINSVGGMTELNGKSYLVKSALTVDTFDITDVDAADIDSTGFTTYTSGGVAEKIYELVSPYHEGEDLYIMKYAQNADVMYIADSEGNDIRKLTRTNHNAWTLSTFSRTADPFPARDITGATAANPVVVTAVAHGFENGDILSIHDVVGMTELNHNRYSIANKAADTFELKDLTGVDVDGTGYTAYSSGGVAGDFPTSVTFFEGRLIYGGTASRPETFWISRSPDPTTGFTRYDDFTTGADDDHAAVFTLSPSASGKVDHIEWLAGHSDFLAVGTFGGIRKVTGGGVNQAITPNSVNIKPITESGVADITPIPHGTITLYVQRGSLTLRSLEYDVLAENFIAVDRNLVADHIFESSAHVKQIAFEEGSPDILWAVRSDGVLAGVSFKAKEDVSGWHRHILGGSHTDDDGVITTPKVLSVGIMPQPNSFDQVWVVAERKIGLAASGLVRRYVEYFSDTARIPDPEKFYTGAANEDADTLAFNAAMYEAAKDFVHLDGSVAYDGSATGTTMTPGAASGDGITFTAGAAVFSSGDVGRQIWKKAIEGVGTGRAVIDAYVSTTVVTCTIVEDFDDVDPIPAGEWFITAGVVSGLDHLEGATVAGFSDGEDLGDFVVTDGAITSGAQSSTLHVGLRYTGLLKTLNIEVGGEQGAAQSRQRNVEKCAIRFLGTLKVKVGTHRYGLEEVKETD